MAAARAKGWVNSRAGHRERQRGEAPQGNGASYKGLGGKPSWGDYRLPTKGATGKSAPAVLRLCEARRRRAKRGLSRGQREGADPGRGAAYPQAVVRPGPGRTKEKIEGTSA